MVRGLRKRIKLPQKSPFVVKCRFTSIPLLTFLFPPTHTFFSVQLKWNSHHARLLLLQRMLLKIEKFKWLKNPFLYIVLGLPRKPTWRLHNKASSPNKGDDFRIAANLADKDDENLHQALLLSQLNLWRELHQPVLRELSPSASLSFVPPHLHLHLHDRPRISKYVYMTKKKVLIIMFCNLPGPPVRLAPPKLTLLNAC